jgi:hypothetical protein
MSRPTASPPPKKASGPNGDHRASQATTTSVKGCPRAARVRDLAGANDPSACRQTLRSKAAARPAARPTRSQTPLEVHCDADAVRSVPRG